MSAPRLFRVKCFAFGHFDIEAATPAAAKYIVFMKAREAGYFDRRGGGFREFLAKRWTVRLLEAGQ